MTLEPHASTDGDHARDHALVPNGASARFIAAIESCQEALSCAHPDPLHAAMREPVARLALESRTCGVPPERMIAELKDVLARLPQFDVRDGNARGEMMRELVSLAITSYFAPKAD
jgi:hypothetical protein